MALLSLYLRNTLRVPAYDLAQMIAGVMIIPLLAPHVFAVMAAEELGLHANYALVLNQFWVVSPVDGLFQIVMLVVVWIHGAIGVFTWLQSRDGSARVMRVFCPFVMALPILAMLGYVEAGRQVIPLDEGGAGFVLLGDPNTAGPTVAAEDIPDVIATARARTQTATRVSLGLVLLALLARWLRVRNAPPGQVRVTCAGIRPATFEAESGMTLLEMARANGVPHANVCRGRGRCGTCRVRVLSGSVHLPPPAESEAQVLRRWNAGADERLACQIKPIDGAIELEKVIEADYFNRDYAETKRGVEAPAGLV